jgi:alpha/beta superfamily hydrolase
MGDDSGHDLHRPPTGVATAAAIVLHPHPAMGGDRHHPLVVALADALSAAGVATLRLDLSDPSVPAAAAVLATEAADLRTKVGVDRLLLIGYSWGAAVVAHTAAEGLAARVLVAPPVTMLDLPPQSEPTLVLVPAHDQYGPPDDVKVALSGWPHATIEVIDGCDHFLAGAIDRITTRAAAWLTDGSRPTPSQDP